MSSCPSWRTCLGNTRGRERTTVTGDGARFDMVVIGAGPAGEKAATHAAYFGKRIALVEREELLGGVVVNSGGVPSKTLRETALYVTGFRKRDIYGVELRLDRAAALQVMHERTSDVMRLMAGRVRANLERHRVEVVRGEARLAGPHHVTVRTDDGERTLEGEVILVATGSHPLRPGSLPFDDPAIVDSDALLAALGDIDSMVVMGGGVIGCEYASILNALGVTVTLVDMAPRLVPLLDSELSTVLAKTFEQHGVRLRLGTGVDSVVRVATRIAVTLTDGERIEADRMLVAVGRRGNTGSLRLREAGVELDAHGLVKVDANLRTTCPSIYDAGDVIGPPTLASVAVEEGRRAASSAFGTRLHEGHFFQAPIGVYTVPEIGQIGMTEKQAVSQGIDHVIGRARFADNARATIAGSTEGLVKLICNRTDGALLGVHVLGEIAAEIVHIGQAVLQHGGTVDYLIHATFNVPTWSDALKYAAFDALQQLERGAPPWRPEVARSVS